MVSIVKSRCPCPSLTGVGLLRQISTPRDVLKGPFSRFLAKSALLGSSSCNNIGFFRVPYLFGDLGRDACAGPSGRELTAPFLHVGSLFLFFFGSQVIP